MRSLYVALFCLVPLATQASIKFEVLSDDPLAPYISGASGHIWCGNTPYGKPVVGMDGKWMELKGVGNGVTYTRGCTESTVVGTSLARPVLWNLRTGSLTVLAVNGYATGASGRVQVGTVNTSNGTHGFSHATAWFGTADSFVDLNPSEYRYTQAIAVGGHAVIGSGRNPNGYEHALFWPRLRPSAIDFGDHAKLFGMDAFQQVGYSFVANADHPMVWRGSVKSAVDLLPPGFVKGNAIDVLDGWQVGAVAKDSYASAALWHGTADSFVPLDKFIPQELGFVWSYVTALTRMPEKLVIYGEAGEADYKRHLVRWTIHEGNRP